MKISKEQLIKDYENKVTIIALKLKRKSQVVSVDIADLVQEGMLALLQCRETFDPSLGTKFWTYAEHRVEGQIKDFIRKHIKHVSVVSLSTDTEEYENHKKNNLEQNAFGHTNAKNALDLWSGESVVTAVDRVVRLKACIDSMSQLEKDIFVDVFIRNEFLTGLSKKYKMGYRKLQETYNSLLFSVKNAVED